MKNTKNITKEVFLNDLLEAFDEADELVLDYQMLTDEELIDCKYAMQARAGKIMRLLGEYITDKEMEMYLYQ